MQLSIWLKGFKDLTIIGCGLIGDKQLQSMLEQFDHIERVFVYDQFSEACARFVDRWQQQRPEINFIATENAKEAVSNGEVVITCTVTDQPYIEYDWLQRVHLLATFLSWMCIKKSLLKLTKS